MVYIVYGLYSLDYGLWYIARGIGASAEEYDDFGRKKKRWAPGLRGWSWGWGSARDLTKMPKRSHANVAGVCCFFGGIWRVHGERAPKHCY